MHSTYNGGKSVAVEKIYWNFKKYIYKHMTAAPINVYFHVSDDNVDKDNNAQHNTIKMKPLDVKSNFYVDVKFDVKFQFNVDFNSYRCQMLIQY